MWNVMTKLKIISMNGECQRPDRGFGYTSGIIAIVGLTKHTININLTIYTIIKYVKFKTSVS